MLNAVIIGNKAAIEEMANMIASVAGDEIAILSRLENINKGIMYLENSTSPDIIFAHAQVDDGLSFEILSKCNVFAPVIFVAEDDCFVKNTFDYNCIAYLVKPLDPSRIRRALTKYRMLNNYFTNGHNHHNQGSYKPVKSRMIVRNGKENIALPITDIVFFRTEHRCVFVTDQQGNEYTSDKSLSDIEAELDKERFFRVNRQYIVNINFIHGFKPYERVKLLVELTVPELKHNVVVSQEMAPQFREWIYNA